MDYRPGGPFPVLATTDSGVGEYSVTQVQQLAAPAAPPVLNQATMSRDLARPGRTVLGTTITARQAYQYLLGRMRDKLGRLVNAVQAYWSVGPVRYRRGQGGDLVPATVRNPISIWRLPGTGIFYAPLDNAGTQYRTLREHAHDSSGTLPVPIMTGTFSTAKIQAFDPLSRVPLGPYEPTAAAPANPASRRALGGADLLPSLNLGGYVSPPVQLITTMAALPTLENRRYGGGAQLDRAPISVIRVRIAGVSGPDPASLNRIKEAAEQIEVRTHLTVDIVAGSSPSPTTISLPGRLVRTAALLLTEDWVRKGVAVTILDAVDRSSVVLFVLILVVCALFVANSASAAVRGRRTELGVLACLGWTRPRLFAAVLSEVAADRPGGGPARRAAVPAAGGGTGPARLRGPRGPGHPDRHGAGDGAGAVPAWLAARAEPVDTVRPAALAVHRARHPSGITGMAVVNVLRTPGRSLVGAVSLAVGVTALTLLIAITLAFRGLVAGTLLGNFVTVQVRGVDYVAVAATVILGVLAVADALLISITERAPELATIRALGWPEPTLRRLVITEGALTGLAGSVAGAVLGLAGAALFTGQLPPALFAAAGAAALAGVLVTCAAALFPAHLLRRLPVAQVLAQE